jgi:hypothetical protein
VIQEEPLPTNEAARSRSRVQAPTLGKMYDTLSLHFDDEGKKPGTLGALGV